MKLRTPLTSTITLGLLHLSNLAVGPQTYGTPWVSSAAIAGPVAAALFAGALLVSCVGLGHDAYQLGLRRGWKAGAAASALLGILLVPTPNPVHVGPVLAFAVLATTHVSSLGERGRVQVLAFGAFLGSNILFIWACVQAVRSGIPAADVLVSTDPGAAIDLVRRVEHPLLHLLLLCGILGPEVVEDETRSTG